MAALRSVVTLIIVFLLSSLLFPFIIDQHQLRTTIAQDACEQRLPTALELAYFSKFVYQDDAGSSVFAGLEDFEGLEESEWQLLLFSDQSAAVGYFGAAYISRERCQVVVAHRGTDPFAVMSDGETPTNFDDHLGTAFENVPQQFMDGVSPFLDQVSTDLNNQGLIEENGWRLTHTGHSFGAVLAELSTAYLPNTSAVTFNSPGSYVVIENMFGTDFANTMDVVSYMGPPNLVNTASRHSGSLIQVDPTWRGFSQNDAFRSYREIVGATDRVIASLVSYVNYSIAANSLDTIIVHFDVERGRPNTPIPVNTWWPQSIMDGLWFFLLTPDQPNPAPMGQLLAAIGLVDSEEGLAASLAPYAGTGMLDTAGGLFDLNSLIIINACGFDEPCIEMTSNACLVPSLDAFEFRCIQGIVAGEVEVVDVIPTDDANVDVNTIEVTLTPTASGPNVDTIEVTLTPTGAVEVADAAVVTPTPTPTGSGVDVNTIQVTLTPTASGPDVETIQVTLTPTSSHVDVQTTEVTLTPTAVEEVTPENMLDIVLVIDTTSSMGDDISAVKREAVSIINRVSESGTAWRIGIVTYRDHPIAPYGDPTDYAARVDLDFTNDRNAIVNTVNLIAVDGGGDEPEAVYSALMTAIGFSWRDGAKKAIILIGDAPPHDPEPRTDYTLSQVLRAAFQNEPVRIYAILIENSASTRVAFQSLADGSSGQMFNASSADVVVDTIFRTITSITEDRELNRVLDIGSRAVVHIPDEQYGLRLGPGREFSLSENLEPGTPVEIIGEPQFNGVNIWWPIRSLVSGYEGWTVEAVDGVVTLIPDDDASPSTTTTVDCTIRATNTVNRRALPSTSAAVTQQLAGGTDIAGLGYNLGGDQFVWFWLEDGSWIRSDIVTASPDCDLVPEVRPWLNDFPAPEGFEAPGVRTSAPDNSTVLNGGVGLSNGAAQNNGDIQVEGYCTRMGYQIGTNEVDWFCAMDNNEPAFTLGARDFDAICRETYNNPRAVAIQDGSGTAWAFRWRCHEVR